ncbi:hypothetical protein OHA37_26830 [Streptomyces sp. NBC_00335]|uniref:hypothetical protein n=1 Tax=unclassified Streptomyces TaxID=2593676 RepID=UPI002253C6F7|nr:MULTISPECIES: hypothetical protein [unclassified Streptomyces]MCX5407465.1 hypothetical protein [Streptomyces sp. NBC_00086]
MKQSTPQHGQRACYLRGCRLSECEADNYRYMARLRLDHYEGNRRRTDAAPASRHVKKLVASTWSQGQIARATGVARRTIGALVTGAHKTISRDTERRILSIPVQPPIEAPRDVDAAGTARRIRALIFMGHNGTAIAARVGLHRDALNRIARGELPSVRASTAEQVAVVYRQLSRVPGTSIRARNLATANGWSGPLAWDETTIDDPAALPEVDEPYTPPAKNGRDSMRMAELEHLLALGESESAIAKQMGASEAYIHDLAVVLRNQKKTATYDDMRKAA